jgi:hypothetical protein
MLYSAWNRLRRPQTFETPPLSQSPAPAPATRWEWDDRQKVVTGRWTNGPPPEPPDLREPIYHSAFRAFQQESSWLMWGRRPGSWWRWRR